MTPSIEVQHVSKRYRKGVAGYRTLREDLYSLTGRLVHLRRHRPEDTDSRHIWALKDVGFQIQQGERMGIIGRNGSGKTTLLRLLAGVTQPTEGKIGIRGRIGVLIEIMAGFHPELTGRENVYLNGAIMGMSQKEIHRKFDEIVAFAEIEDFIDTPIKRYSSGMHVRLGFAVAAHLEPDILLVDEVLAVGDAAFQEKCLGKMEGVAREGRTVVFVSHNMATVKSLCDKAMLLENGRLVGVHTSAEAVELYLSRMEKQSQGATLKDRPDREGSGEARMVDAWISAGLSPRTEHAVPADAGALSFNLTLETSQALDAAGVVFGVYDATRQCLLWLDSRTLLGSVPLKAGQTQVSCTLPPGFGLAGGKYSVNIALFGKAGLIDRVPWAITFEMADDGRHLAGRQGAAQPLLHLKQDWQIS